MFNLTNHVFEILFDDDDLWRANMFNVATLYLLRLQIGKNAEDEEKRTKTTVGLLFYRKVTVFFLILIFCCCFDSPC